LRRRWKLPIKKREPSRAFKAYTDGSKGEAKVYTFDRVESDLSSFITAASILLH